jgi:hypothetical protein
MKRPLNRRPLVIGVVIALALTAWRLRPRAAAIEGGTLEVPWPLGLGSRVRRMRHRMTAPMQPGGADTLEDLEGQGVEADRGVVRFDWAFGSTEAEHVRTVLAMESIATDEPRPATEANELVAEKLSAAGVHLDQEAGDALGAVPRSHVMGATSPRHLARAIEQALDTRHVGVIVDATREVVEIDEHRDVGRGNVLLIDPAGRGRLLRHGTMRALVAALAAAARDDDAPTFSGDLGDEARSTIERAGPASPDLTQLPPTVDELLRELGGATSVAVTLTMRLAEHLGATRPCVTCATTIVHIAPVADALARHYGAPHRLYEVAAALATSTIETGHPEAPERCGAHGSTAA